VITNNDPADFGLLNNFFDVLAADVPCSGEGMFRKDPVALKEWSPGHVRLCAERQKRIIADTWPALTPCGLLIYSTCTYNREENEDTIEWICRELGAEVVESPHRFMPHKTKGEGFCITVLRKTGMPSDKRKPVRTAAKSSSLQTVPLLHPERFTIVQEHRQSVAFPVAYAADYLLLKKHLKILSAGVALGEQKGKDWIPAHDLAMSIELAADTFPVWEVDRPDALRYLRKEALQDIPAGLPKGYILITQDHHPLGFVKNIGTRANNLYPQEWRIRIQ
jgi:NOL1/NOP2/fmu family ribosome biogenesis protein